jgi:hypothetical protein
MIVVIATKGQALFGVTIIFIVYGVVRYAIGIGKQLFYPSSKNDGEEETEISSVDV